MGKEREGHSTAQQDVLQLISNDTFTIGCTRMSDIEDKKITFYERYCPADGQLEGLDRHKKRTLTYILQEYEEMTMMK